MPGLTLNPIAIGCIDGAWVAWLIVWIAMASRVKSTIVRESLARRAAHILPLSVAGAVLFICPPGQGWWTCQDVLRRAPWMAPSGALIVIAGLGFAVWARILLAGNWSGIVTLKQDHELVRAGPYGIVRHPIYTGLLSAIFGTAIAIDQWRGVLALAVVTASFLVKMRTEETFMRRAFADDYARYCRQVAALIPGVW